MYISYYKSQYHRYQVQAVYFFNYYSVPLHGILMFPIDTPKSITMNKASGGDGIPVELFQILKDDAVKVLHSVCQQIWKTQQWPQDLKRSVFISIP